MDSYTISVGQFFDDKVCLLVPLFQRPYVWRREEQWAPLWADIVAAFNRVVEANNPRPHFIGAVVLEAMQRKVGQLERRLVIDGQQRITTLQILLRAFADAIPANDEFAGLRRDIEELVTNTHSHVREPWERFKIWPTNGDREAFQAVMTRDEVAPPFGEERAVSPSRLAEAYRYFHDQIRLLLQNEQEGFKERAEQLQTALTQCLNIVVIDIEDQDDSQVIFETLNARGTPLLPADLIKNAILSRARWEKADEETIYLKYWQPLDIEPYWREEVGRGHARRARIDLFLQNYLTARTLKEVAVGHLYTTYRDWVEDSKQTAEWHSAEMHRYASIYRKLQNWSVPGPEKIFLNRLDVLGIVSAGPFLLELFQRHYGAKPEVVRNALRILDSFLIRRTVCGLNTRGYNRLFLDLTRVVVAEEDFVTAIRNKLQGSGAASMRWPSDNEFRDAWITRPVGTDLRRERVRAILEAVEMALRSAKSETITFNETLHVEHLLPESWQEHYSLPPDSPADAVEKRNRAVQTFGNLSLLTRSLNPSVSNGPWRAKHEQILQHSALALNRTLPAETWDGAGIQGRAEALWTAARSIWEGPTVEYEYDDAAEPDDFEVQEGEAGGVGGERKPRFTPVSFRDQCFPKIGAKLGFELKRHSQAIWSNVEHKTAVLCMTSREYVRPDHTGYWFAFHPHQQKILAKFERAYVAFACGSPDTLFVITYLEFQTWLPSLNRTELPDRSYWHVKIHRRGDVWTNNPKAGNSERTLNRFLT